jgi:nitrogen regulatory protein P-II 1
MKKIEAIIRTSKFEDVKARLKRIRIDFFSNQDLSEIENNFLCRHLCQQGKVYNVHIIPIDYSLLVN